MAKPQIRFSARWRNEVKVKGLLAQAATAAQLSLAQKRLEKLLLRRTRDRFASLGDNPRAQRDPTGKVWTELAASTLRDHKNPNQILTKSGDLRLSVKVLGKRMAPGTLFSNTGGGFRIGVSPSSPAAVYAGIHQRGRPGHTPQRRFLGISKEDVESVQGFIDRNFVKSGIPVRK